VIPMRIDGVNPIDPESAQPVVRGAKAAHVPDPAPAITDHVETHPKPEVSPTNVLVEMQPGNVVVYKFIDTASGRLIQQIPSEQMLSLSEITQSNEKPAKK
jgi:hypothetical protein